VLVIALCKGRFLDPSLDILARSGIRFSDDVATSRKLIFESEDKRCRAVLVKPADVPTYVEYGAADLGIAGRDVLMESGADVLQPLGLNFGFCKIAVAGPNQTRVKTLDYIPEPATGTEPTSGNHVVEGFNPRSNSPTLRIATKYPRITLDYYNARGIPVEIIPLSGSIELAPLIGLADRIVDLVETGRTLKENGLEVLEVIAESSSRLVINRASYQTKREEVLALIQALEKAVQ
jgi:ATP phosphoribosyltransferase